MESTIRREVEQITRIYETIKLTSEVSVERETMVSKIADNEKVTIKSYLVGGNVPKGSSILLADKNVRELHRQHNIFHTKDEEVKKEVYKYEVDPYSIIEELGNSWSEYLELLIYDWNNHILSGWDGKEIAKRFYFDYMSGIKDGNFNLKELLSHLKTLSSIELSSEIKDVPYYNYDVNGCKHQIEFTVRPTDEEWKKILITEPLDVYLGDFDIMRNRVANYYGFGKFLKRR